MEYYLKRPKKRVKMLTGSPGRDLNMAYPEYEAELVSIISCVHDKETLGSKKSREFVDKLTKKNSVPCSQLCYVSFTALISLFD